MKSWKEKILYILIFFLMVTGIYLILAGIYNLLNAEQELSARVIIQLAITVGGIVAFCAAVKFINDLHDLNKDIKEYNSTSTKVKQILKQNNPTQVYYNSSSKCEDCKMFCDIISNLNVSFFATLDANDEIQLIAKCGDEQVYEKIISNPVYFLHYFRFEEEES